MDFSFERLCWKRGYLWWENQKNNIEQAPVLLHMHCEVSRSIKVVGAKDKTSLLLKQENASVCNPYSIDSFVDVHW